MGSEQSTVNKVKALTAACYLARYAGGVDVLLADRAVGPAHPLHALVRPLQVVGQAHVAPVAVEVVLPATNPAHKTSTYKSC